MVCGGGTLVNVQCVCCWRNSWHPQDRNGIDTLEPRQLHETCDGLVTVPNVWCVSVGIRRLFFFLFVSATGGFTVCFCHPGGGFFGASSSVTSSTDMLPSYSSPLSMISISNHETSRETKEIVCFERVSERVLRTKMSKFSAGAAPRLSKIPDFSTIWRVNP